ncbi:MAG: LapA family protein [Deinococcota bacterium]
MRTAVLIVILVLALLFAILNRHALMFGHTLNLGFATYQNVPLGLILLVTALVLALIFYFWAGVAGLRAQADSARLLRDMEALRVSLDSQESSRFAQLQTYIDQRFNALGSGVPGSAAPELEALSARLDALQRDVNVQLAQIDDYLKRRLG